MKRVGGNILGNMTTQPLEVMIKTELTEVMEASEITTIARRKSFLLVKDLDIPLVAMREKANAVAQNAIRTD